MTVPGNENPDPFHAYAAAQDRMRRDERRQIEKSLMSLMRSADLVERAECCPLALIGLVAHCSWQLNLPGFIEDLRVIGRAKMEGFEVQTPVETPAVIQVTIAGEPLPALKQRLSAEGFQRMTPAGVQPVIYFGFSLFSTWKGEANSLTRVTRCDVPGGAIHGMASGSREVHGRTEMPGSGDPASAITVGPTASATLEDHAPMPDVPLKIAPGLFHAYQWADLKTDFADAGFVLHSASAVERDALVLAVVSRQGPLVADTVIEAIRRGLKLRTIRSNSRSKIGDALSHLQETGAIIRTGDAYHVADQPIVPRDRTGCDPCVRHLTSLPGIEVDVALIEAVRFGARDDEAAGNTAARLLGLAPKTEAARRDWADIVRASLQRLLADGRLLRDEDLGLAKPPADADRSDPECVDPDGAAVGGDASGAEEGPPTGTEAE